MVGGLKRRRGNAPYGGGLKEEDREACPYEGALKGRRKGNAPQSLKRGARPPNPLAGKKGDPSP